MVFISGQIVFLSRIDANVFKVINGTWGTKKQRQAEMLILEDSMETHRLGWDGLFIPLLPTCHYEHKPVHGSGGADTLSCIQSQGVPGNLLKHMGPPWGDALMGGASASPSQLLSWDMKVLKVFFNSLKSIFL